MRKTFFCMAAGLILLACCSNKSPQLSSAEKEFAKIQAENAEIKKYRQYFLNEQDSIIDVRVKYGEACVENYLFRPEDRVINFRFEPYRHYEVWLSKGEKVKDMTRHKVVTNKRTLKIRWIYE